MLSVIDLRILQCYMCIQSCCTRILWL